MNNMNIFSGNKFHQCVQYNTSSVDFEMYMLWQLKYNISVNQYKLKKVHHFEKRNNKLLIVKNSEK